METGATEWSDYYVETNCSLNAFTEKKSAVAEFLERAKHESVWDIGANAGVFIRIAGDAGTPTLSMDMDPAAVELNYLEYVREGRSEHSPASYR